MNAAAKRRTPGLRGLWREGRFDPRQLGPVAPTLVAALAGQAALLVTGTIAAHVLGVEDRGHLALLVLVPLLVSQLASLGVPLAITYAVARDKNLAATVAGRLPRLVVGQVFAAVGAQALILGAIMADESNRLLTAGAISLIVAPAMLLQSYALAFLQGAERFIAFNVWRAAPVVAYATVTASLAVASAATLITLAVAWSATNLVCALGTLATAHGGLPRRRAGPGPGLKWMIGFGLRGLIGSASPLEAFRPDQAIVGFFLSASALGLYVSALAVANLPRFLAQSVGMVAFPVVASGRSSGSASQAEVWKWTFRCAALTAPVVVVLELFSAQIVNLFFGDEFAAATTTTRILLIGSFLLGLRRVLTDALRGANRPGIGSLGEIASWLVFVPAAAVLAALEGVNGVAWAVVASAGAGLLVLIVSLHVVPDRARPEARSTNPEMDDLLLGESGP